MPSKKRPSHIFLFAHQDDEWGVLPVIRTLCQQRNSSEVHCFYLTSGVQEPHKSARRDGESRSVLCRQGVNEGNIHFLGSIEKIPGRGLRHELERMLACLENVIGHDPQIMTVTVPAWEGGHPDHDAAHLLGLALARRFNAIDRTQQFPLYNSAGRPHPFFRVFAPLRSNGPITLLRYGRVELLCAVVTCLSYPSQRKTFVSLAPFACMARLRYGGVHLQSVSLERIHERPHNGAMLSETRFKVPFRQFQADTKHFQTKHLGLPKK